MLPPMYDPEAIQPMRDELTAVGFKQLSTPEQVEGAVKNSKGTVLCVINSVCGCAAGSARPGIGLALQNKLIPDELVTVFAGNDREAVERVREYHAEAAPPSSPSIVLFKEGRVLSMLQRSDIERRSPQELAQKLVAIFNTHCSRVGPSIPPEEFSKLKHIQACGSNIPRI